VAKRKEPMAPISYKTAGAEWGNAAAAAALCVGSDGKAISADTFQWYVRTADPNGDNPPPKAERVDPHTRQSMYRLKRVREWHAKRPGRGNWGGIGARARLPKDQQGEPVDTPAPEAGAEPASQDA